MRKKGRSVKQQANRRNGQADKCGRRKLREREGRETERERAGALRYSRASDSPRASTCSTCPTFQDLLSRTPEPNVGARAKTRIHARFDGPTLPGVSHSCSAERRPPPSPIPVSFSTAALGLSLSHRRTIRPRLSHRYSRGLLGARGKMRQVVVRSRSPGTREIRLLFSPPFGPSGRSARSAAAERHSFVRVY